MPTNKVEPGDAVEYLDSAGDTQIVAEYNETDGQLEVNDANGNPADQRVGALEATDGLIAGETRVGALEATDGLIAGETIDSASGSDSIQISNINATDYQQIIIRLESFSLSTSDANPATLELTIDNNDSNGQYGYIYNDGTKNDSQNTLELLKVAGGERIDIAGNIILDVVQTGSGTDGYALAESGSLPFRSLGNVANQTVAGGTIISPTIDQSIELFATNGSGKSMDAKLYGVK